MPAAAWALTGNAGTNPSVDSVGTTDNEPLAIKTNGQERLRVDASGNVGIGTNAPVTRLHLSGAGDEEISISSTDTGGRRWTLQSSGNVAGNVGKFQVIDRTVSASRLTIDTSGNVGVGTTSPQKPLDVASSGGIRISQTTPASNTNEVYFADNGQIRSLDDNHRIIFNRAANELELREYGAITFSPGATAGQRTAAVVIQSNGQVGMSAADPSAQLAVQAFGPGGGGPNAAAIIGRVTNLGSPAGSQTAGVRGISDTGHGVQGQSDSHIGVEGTVGTGVAVYAEAQEGYGVFSISHIGPWAGVFEGSVLVTGTLSKPGGGFRIDHPLDPANKYLNHSFVESSEMKNIYDGVAVLDDNGEASVTLPDWFDTLNQDFRYQLTPIGAPAPQLHVTEEIVLRAFRIAGGAPGQRISWQVTGSRKDPWAQANRLVVEQLKPAIERGRYLHPELFGENRSMNVTTARFPQGGRMQP